MPPPIDLDALDPKRRSGLLGGLQRFGGLLGRNFDRNAVGGIDAAMGPGGLTQDMRRSLRSNALMSIGQMLATQGKTPIQEGLHRGQERIFGAWKAGRDREREDATKAAMAKLGQGMGGLKMPSAALTIPGGEQPAPGPAQAPGLTIPGTGGPLDLQGLPTGSVTGPPIDLPSAPGPRKPPTMGEQRRAKIAQLEAKAQQYVNLGTDIEEQGRQLMAHDPKIGMELIQHAAKYHTEANNLLEKAANLEPKIIDQRKGVDRDTGKTVMYVTNDLGEVSVLPIDPPKNMQISGMGGHSEAIDTDAVTAGMKFTHTEPPEAVANRTFEKEKHGDAQKHQKFMEGLAERSTRSTEAGVGIARMNAMINMDENTRKAYDALLPKAQSGEAASKLAVAHTLPHDLDKLEAALRANPRQAVLGMKGADANLKRLLEQAADKVGRLRSGGAIGVIEGQNFKGQMVGWLDLLHGDQSGALEAIAALRREAAITAEGLDPGGAMRARISRDGTVAAPQLPQRPPSVFNQMPRSAAPGAAPVVIRTRPRPGG